MREQFDRFRNGCPWITITESRASQCKATNDVCWYKSCAILYWLRMCILPMIIPNKQDNDR